MGKRNRGEVIEHSSTSPDSQCPSTMGSESAEETPCLPLDTSLSNALSSVADVAEIPSKQPNSHLSLGRHHSNVGRPMFSKRPRHQYGNQSSRRSLAMNYSGATSCSRSSPFFDERLRFKLGGRYSPEFGHHKGKHHTEWKEKAIWSPERIRSSSTVLNNVPSETTKISCRICDKSLRWPTIVAVLSCGHFYHAECLEHRTHIDDIRDPPCPLCSELLSKAEPA
ncbi:hypothetical protein Drorol1_Dr00011643 [Drosera rotundifolia]